MNYTRFPGIQEIVTPNYINDVIHESNEID